MDGSSNPGTWGTETGKNSKEERHCDANKVGDSSACCECPAGAVCKLGTTIESMRIKDGFYRHSRASAQTFECRHPNACAGTSTDPESDDVEKMRLEGDELCRVGFTGPLCSTCNDDYYLDGVDEVCVACDSKEAAKQSQSASKEILPIVVGVVFTLVIVVVAAVSMPGSVQDWYNRKVERIMTVSHHVTILIINAQLIVNLQTVTVFRGGKPFPEPFATVVRLCEIFNLDAFAVFRFGCVAGGFNYITKLYTATLSSIAVVIIIFLRRLYKVMYGGIVWDGEEMKFMFLLMFFTLPTTSMIIAKAFACVEFENGEGGVDKFMLVDMTLRCDDDRYTGTHIFAVSMGFVFPIGVPLAAYILLWTRRREIEARTTRLGGPELNVLSFFFRTYAPNRWRTGVVEMLRRLMPCWLLLLQHSSRVLLVALFISFLFLYGWREIMPCYDASSDLLGYASGWFVVTCILGLLASATMDDQVLGTSEEVVAWFLVLINVGILGLVAWLSARYDKIDIYDEREFGPGGTGAEAEAEAGAEAGSEACAEGQSAGATTTNGSGGAARPTARPKSTSFLEESRKSKTHKARRRRSGGFGVSHRSNRAGAAVAPAPAAAPAPAPDQAPGPGLVPGPVPVPGPAPDLRATVEPGPGAVS
mmetsp:Transcript_106080/g.306893  ORF Transcript_106080/g.306893 Transcript_106080/m.306893 type:complete len:646 (-) Transcript_106080:221-2158(-)